MNRRSFLQTMLACAAAPAVVRAEALMKIVVPKQELLVANLWGVQKEYLHHSDACRLTWWEKCPNENWAFRVRIVTALEMHSLNFKLGDMLGPNARSPRIDYGSPIFMPECIKDTSCGK